MRFHPGIRLKIPAWVFLNELVQPDFEFRGNTGAADFNRGGWAFVNFETVWHLYALAFPLACPPP